MKPSYFFKPIFLKTAAGKIESFLNFVFLKTHFQKEYIKNFYSSLPILVASVITGVVAVLYAKIFALVERTGITLFTEVPLLYLLLMPACFFISWFLVHRFAPFARGSGIPQVIAALELSETHEKEKVSMFVSFRIIVVKILSSLVLVFGGGAIGREGPTIQISGSIFRTIGKYIPKQWPKPSERIMILTGSAAGLAAAFNTPLGGIVFAIEELSKSHFTAFRTSLLASVIVAGMMAQMLLGPYLYLGYPSVSGLVFSMMGIIVLTAVIVGLTGTLFSKSILWILRYRNKYFSYPIFAVLAALVLYSLAYFTTPLALGSGKETMIALLFGKENAPSITLVSARIVGPLLSFTSGGAGGIFAPALSCGAALGAFISSYAVLSPEQSNVVILVGMVAFLTAVTRSPFTSSILVLEMTDRHSLIFFLMLTGLVSYLSAWAVDHKSLYEHLKETYIESTTHPTS